MRRLLYLVGFLLIICQAQACPDFCYCYDDFVTCSDFNDLDLTLLPNTVETLILSEGEMEEIPAAFFARASNLKSVELTGFNVRLVRGGAFRGLSNLDSLIIKGSSFDIVEPDGFSGISGIAKFLISDCHFGRVGKHAFAEITDVSDWRMWSNYFATLSDEVFYAIGRIHAIQLYQNNISYIGNDVFADAFEVDYVNFYMNTINVLSNGSLSYIKDNADRLVIYANKFQCSCDLAWITQDPNFEEFLTSNECFFSSDFSLSDSLFLLSEVNANVLCPVTSPNRYRRPTTTLATLPTLNEEVEIWSDYGGLNPGNENIEEHNMFTGNVSVNNSLHESGMNLSSNFESILLPLVDSESSTLGETVFPSLFVDSSSSSVDSSIEVDITTPEYGLSSFATIPSGSSSTSLPFALSTESTSGFFDTLLSLKDNSSSTTSSNTSKSFDELLSTNDNSSSAPTPSGSIVSTTATENIQSAKDNSEYTSSIVSEFLPPMLNDDASSSESLDSSLNDNEATATIAELIEFIETDFDFATPFPKNTLNSDQEKSMTSALHESFSQHDVAENASILLSTLKSISASNSSTFSSSFPHASSSVHKTRRPFKMPSSTSLRSTISAVDRATTEVMSTPKSKSESITDEIVQSFEEILSTSTYQTTELLSSATPDRPSPTSVRTTLSSSSSSPSSKIPESSSSSTTTSTTYPEESSQMTEEVTSQLSNSSEEIDAFQDKLNEIPQDEDPMSSVSLLNVITSKSTDIQEEPAATFSVEVPFDLPEKARISSVKERIMYKKAQREKAQRDKQIYARPYSTSAKGSDSKKPGNSAVSISTRNYIIIVSIIMPLYFKRYLL